MKKQLVIALSLLSLLGVLSAWNTVAIELLALKVTVLDERGNPQEGATVKLYASEDDAENDRNAIVAPKLTNKKGKVTFKKGLKPKTYYVHAQKGELLSESGLKTSTLQKNRINQLNIIIGEGKDLSLPGM